MNRRLFVASVPFWMLSLQIGVACAAGPYDGEWNGSATATTGRCKPALVTLTVAGKVVTGQARFERDIANISGTVLEDVGWGDNWLSASHRKFRQGHVRGDFRRFRLCMEHDPQDEEAVMITMPILSGLHYRYARI
jgi:hypothetical protein